MEKENSRTKWDWKQEMMLSNALSTVWSQNIKLLLSPKSLIFTIDVSCSLMIFFNWVTAFKSHKEIFTLINVRITKFH